MSEKLKRRLLGMLERVQLVPHERSAYVRLWECYQRSFIQDEELCSIVGDAPNRFINGVTEPVAVEDFESALSMPETIGLEIHSEEPGLTLGFAIVRYATKTHESRKAFQEYFDHVLLSGMSPEFTSDIDKIELENALELGNVVCSVEFVAPKNSVAAVAILLATYKRIVLRTFNATNAFLMGKCLDEVSIGSAVNIHGNVGVRSLVDGVAMRKIAITEQSRELKCAVSTTHAQLKFGVYLGDFTNFRERCERLGLPLDGDI